MLKTNLQILQEVREFLNNSQLNIEKYVTKKGAFYQGKKAKFFTCNTFHFTITQKDFKYRARRFF